MVTGTSRTSVVKPTSFPREFLAPGPLVGSRGLGTPKMTQHSGEFIHSSLTTKPPPRLSLKAGKTASGYVDGAWWPGSLDLVAEIPALVGQLSGLWGAVNRVSYDLDAWLPAPRSVPAGGRRVRLDGFRGRHTSDAVHVIGVGPPPLTLLVILPSTGRREATEALRRAGSTGNQETIDDLLQRGPRSGGPESGRKNAGTLAGIGVRSRIDDDTADLGRWDAEGGHDRRRAGY